MKVIKHRKYANMCWRTSRSVTFALFLLYRILIHYLVRKLWDNSKYKFDSKSQCFKLFCIYTSKELFYTLNNKMGILHAYMKSIKWIYYYGYILNRINRKLLSFRFSLAYAGVFLKRRANVLDQLYIEFCSRWIWIFDLL